MHRRNSVVRCRGWLLCWLVWLPLATTALPYPAAAAVTQSGRASPAPLPAAASAPQMAIRLENRMHSGQISVAALDSRGLVLATYSAEEHDRTLRVWLTSDGSLLQTFRFPVSTQPTFCSLAVAPGGETLAMAACQSGASILLLDRTQQKIVQNWPGPAADSPITHLAFSVDGRRLVAAAGSGALAQYDVTTGGRQLARPDSTAAPTALAVDRNGRVFLAHRDGQVALYGADLALLARTALAGGAASDLAPSPDGQRLALSSGDTRNVLILSGFDLQPVLTPPQPGAGAEGGFTKLAWAPDGASLCLGGTYRRQGRLLLRCLRGASLSSVREFAVGQEELLGIALLGGDSVVYADRRPSWGVITANDARPVAQGPARLQLQPQGLGLDYSGGLLSLRPALGRAALTFSPRDHQLAPGPALDAEKSAAASPGAQAATSERPLGAAQLRELGWTLPAAVSATALAVALAPRSETAAAVREGELILFGRNGAITLQTKLPGRAEQVALSGNGRLAAVAFSDGTIRWFRTENGAECLALYAAPDGKRWLAWTPSGYYDTSLEGERLVGWEVARDAVHSADMFRMGTFREHYYRPDITSRVLFSKDEASAQAEADAASPRAAPHIPIRELLPPIVRLIDPRDGTSTKVRSLQVRVAVRSPSGDAVDAVWPLVQGTKDGTQARGFARESGELSGGSLASPHEEQFYSLPITIQPEDTSILIYARTRHNRSEAALLQLRWQGVGSKAAPERPNLYMLSVGVSAYRHPGLRLRYPAKDAADLGTAFAEQQGRRYAQVAVRELADDRARRAEILSGLEWLVQNTTSRDVAVLFLAGHGISDPESGRYAFLPYDYDGTASLLDSQQILLALGRVRGRVLLFLDTCHSGGMLGMRRAGGLELVRLTNELANGDSGVIVYAASTGDQVSREATRWGNGAFTKAVVEGLRGGADLSRSGRIMSSALENYVGQRVRELTSEEQTPTSAKSHTVPDFLLALVTVRTPLYRRWWLWGVVGVGTAALVTGVLLATRPWEEKPPVLTF